MPLARAVSSSACAARYDAPSASSVDQPTYRSPSGTADSSISTTLRTEADASSACSQRASWSAPSSTTTLGEAWPATKVICSGASVA